MPVPQSIQKRLALVALKDAYERWSNAKAMEVHDPSPENVVMEDREKMYLDGVISGLYVCLEPEEIRVLVQQAQHDTQVE